MGIASGVFWIVFGLLYILYKAFREHPSETASGVIAFVVIMGGIIGFTLLYRWMMDQNLVIGSIFAFGVLGTACVLVGRYQYKEHLKREKERAEYEAWMDEVRKTITEKDYEDYARTDGWRYYANMNPKSVMYWKNEPYFSKIKLMVEIKRSCEMRKEREAAKLADCASSEASE